MAYDPNDAADKKVVGKLVSDAVTAALAEAAEEHAGEIQGLKTKNADLVVRLKKARDGQNDPELVAKLETDLEKSQEQLKEAKAAMRKVEKERDTHKQTAEAETIAARKLLVDQGLTEALTANKVATQFLPAVKKLLESQVTIKADGDNRTAMVGDKPLGEFVKTWSLGDEGKHYVVAPGNGGSNAPGGSANGNGSVKTLARPAFNQLTPLQQSAFSKEGGRLTD